MYWQPAMSSLGGGGSSPSGRKSATSSAERNGPQVSEPPTERGVDPVEPDQSSQTETEIEIKTGETSIRIVGSAAMVNSIEVNVIDAEKDQDSQT